MLMGVRRAQGLTSSGDGTGWDICYRPWGDTFLTALLVLAAVYAAVAVAITRQPKLPDSHRQRLRELQGLVADGVQFCRGSGARSAGRPGYSPLREGEGQERRKSSGRQEGKERRTKAGSDDREPPTKRKKKSTREQREAATSEASLEPEAAPASTSKQTPSGGGGKWVHVP